MVHHFVAGLAASAIADGAVLPGDVASVPPLAVMALHRDLEGLRAELALERRSACQTTIAVSASPLEAA